VTAAMTDVRVVRHYKCQQPRDYREPK
jgi:hypothetical protein